MVARHRSALCAEKVEKYKGQQLHVKSNKQYDALTKEIEAAEAKSKKLEKDMDLLEGKIQLLKGDIETTTAQLEEVSGELNEKQKELREVNKEHEKEELKLQHGREKILARVEDADVLRYERIRKAKGGQAVVAVKRELGLPIRFIGVGERLVDLEVFDPDRFAARLLAD